MPRPQIHPYWLHQVRAIVEREPSRSAKHIENFLQHQGSQLDPPRHDWPRERTIRKIRSEHLKSPPETRQQYRLFHWPEAMVAGLLPWEASRPLLDLLRVTQSFGARPTVHQAQWYWRAYQASPNAPMQELQRAAGHLAGHQATAGEIPEVEARSVEGWLTYQPWTEEGETAYRQAIETLGVPDLRRRGITIREGTDIEAVRAIFGSYIFALPEWATEYFMKRLDQHGHLGFTEEERNAATRDE